MEYSNKNTIYDSEVYVQGNLHIGDVVVSLDAPEEEVFRCFNCETPSNDERNIKVEFGFICHICGQQNFDRPANRNVLSGQFQNMKPDVEDDYRFSIKEIEEKLKDRNAKANEEALEIAKEAIKLSLRTPDAYIYKALCEYYMAKPRIKLVLNSAYEVVSPIETARRINSQYELLRIISNIIAGRYFRALRFSIDKLCEQLQKKRQDIILSRGNSVNSEKNIENIHRLLSEQIGQFAVCYKISLNPLFLRSEIQYYMGHGGNSAPLLALKVDGFDKIDVNNLLSLKLYLLSIQQNKYYIYFGTRQFGVELKSKIENYQKTEPNRDIPPMRLYSPFGEQGLTIEEIKANIEAKIRNLEIIEQEKQAQRKREEAAHRRAMEQQRREEAIKTAGIVAVSILGLGAVVWIFSAAYTWLSEQKFVLSDFLYALIKIPLALVMLFFGTILFIVFWLLEAFTGWLLGWLWNVSAPIWEWAWDDVVVSWLWQTTNGIYLFLGVLIWGGILKLAEYVKAR